eukprot:CAMPEP_0172913460 /NCGR_PEP_ID=MMETSP1075-20121228/190404_1 /TAXON_ID=2916 /ORGANISM="Ceratium fusus, Strain PA161109" /LENGTH=46 /DNA_ID= /DNA_START= /DNA_END= /DNA_ORIENTATION=
MNSTELCPIPVNEDNDLLCAGFTGNAIIEAARLALFLSQACGAAAK